MLVAFLGTHVPLLTLLLYFLTINTSSFQMTLRVLGIALVATLIGTAATLYAIHNLLAPVILTFLTLREYLNQKKLPNLPTKFTDEAGILMADTVRTIKQLDEVIQHLTNYDNLTGLPNQALFQDRLQQALIRAQDNNRLLAVISLKLKNLSEISNALGRDAGDLLLREAAQRLSASVRPTDLLSRVAKDEFALAQTELTVSEDILPLCKEILSTFSTTFFIENKPLHLSVSLGISIYPFDGSQVDQLWENASTAMYQARQQAQSNYQFFGAEMKAQLQERLTLENELRYALTRNEIHLHYQPRVDLGHNQIVGVEALVRWQHPELGFVSPVKFIPIAEANGLIVPIGEWVLRTACTQNRIWQQAGLPPIRMAVNLSARQFEQSDLVERINQILEETGMDVSYLELEVTESLFVDNVQNTINILQQLRDRGITLALDDFGTGYSSLNYLRHFPIDTLKIDRSFVRDVVADPHNAAVTNAIISLAKSLELKITAEGVETQDQFEYIKSQGCNEIQGYYFSRPIPADALATLLQTGVTGHESLS
ncbi:putative bifunctional diguanylate cyclase/phosphodiesterase [Microcoleus sp. FACHB-672]|uniref:putative bifunctional diguanylate cyclase/phosphodiesterase n=1 Tax=Microcoleus sp. FACHB-672 TaxID=2692825 RepID=UPI001F548686|nr:GGDEF domain-containing phosphodiesterase [Microcoleus sp. FACHB-672]